MHNTAGSTMLPHKIHRGFPPAPNTCRKEHEGRGKPSIRRRMPGAGLTNRLHYGTVNFNVVDWFVLPDVVVSRVFRSAGGLCPGGIAICWFATGRAYYLRKIREKLMSAKATAP